MRAQGAALCNRRLRAQAAGSIHSEATSIGRPCYHYRERIGIHRQATFGLFALRGWFNSAVRRPPLLGQARHDAFSIQCITPSGSARN